MKLEEIKKLCDEATPGPWVRHETYSDVWFLGEKIMGNNKTIVYQNDGHNAGKEEDIKFIAASRTLIPKLLAVAEAAKKYMHIDHFMTPEAGVSLRNALEDLERDE